MSGPLAGFFILLAASAAAAEPAVVSEIRIEPRNVFDPAVPGEDLWLFRIANRIHRTTRDAVVRREILLPAGGAWDPLKALESERNLRSLGFLRDAEVRAAAAGPGRLDLTVRTRDSWTLLPVFGVGTEGGDNFLILGLREGNLLGLGKTVSLLHSEQGPVVRNEFRYEDPRLLGTWHSVTGHLAATSEGDEAGARVSNPWVAFDSPYADDLSWARITQEEVLYRDAEESSKFLQDYASARSVLGLRASRSGNLVQRVELGTEYDSHRFTAKKETAPGTLPAGRTLSGVALGYSLIQPRYLKESDINSMVRVEDFNLGNEFMASVAALPEALGSDRDRWSLSALDQQGLGLGPGRFALAQAGVQGRLAGGRPENAMFFANLNLFWKAELLLPHTLVAHLEFNGTRALDGEKQIVLGGQSGLRGYRSNSFTGGKSVLLNLEDRLFYPRELFHLMYLGGVVFFDSGAVAPEGGGPELRELKSDIGFGLRFSPSRSTTGRVLRIDLAYALNEGPGSDRWVVSVRAGQAFAIFNSTNRSALRRPDAVITGEFASERLLRQ